MSVPTYCVDLLAAEVPAAATFGRMSKFSLTPLDMRVAVALADHYLPRSVLEFGVNQGATAKCLLDHCPCIEKYVGVDLRPELFPQRSGIVPKFAGQHAFPDPRFLTVLTDGTPEDFRRQIAPLAPFDCILMDADHDELPTAHDSQLCAEFAAPFCLWLWHDYNVVSRARPQGPIWGVKAALDKLNASGRWIMTPDQADRDPFTCCSVAWELRRPAP